MSTGERCVATNIDFDGWREPPEAQAAADWPKKSGLGVLHLRGYGLHPCRINRAFEQADGCRVARERFVGECVDDIDRYHGTEDTVALGTARIG